MTSDEKPLHSWDQYLLFLYLWVHLLSFAKFDYLKLTSCISSQLILWCKGLSTSMMHGPVLNIILCNSPKIWRVIESVVEVVTNEEQTQGLVFQPSPALQSKHQNWHDVTQIFLFWQEAPNTHENNNSERYLSFHASVHLHLNRRIVFTTASLNLYI